MQRRDFLRFSAATAAVPALLGELAAMFADVMRDEDRLYLLPVYDAGGSADRRINSEVLVERLVAAGCRASVVATPDAAVTRVIADARQGDTVLTLGARDPQLPVMAREIVAGLNHARA